MTSSSLSPFRACRTTSTIVVGILAHVPDDARKRRWL
jgi:hypothetical protein